MLVSHSLTVLWPTQHINFHLAELLIMANLSYHIALPKTVNFLIMQNFHFHA